MANFDFTERMQTHYYGFVATRVCTLLERINKKRVLHEKDYAMLKDGANIMSQIASGSLLVENKTEEGGLAPSIEGLTVFGRALSVLSDLGNDLKEGALSDLFIRYRDCLDNLAQKKTAAIDDIDTLQSFFSVLSDVIHNDIKSERLNLPNNHGLFGMQRYQFAR